jgi:hypothetical protein
MQVIFLVIEHMVASEEGFCFMELINADIRLWIIFDTTVGKELIQITTHYSLL